MTTPEEFGPYVLLRSLGKGGMAEVFLAETDSHGVRRPVAIKRLLPPFNSDELLVSMLADEARLSVWLAHPAIVQVFDFGRVGQTYYIAMEFVDGCDLCRLVRVRGRARGRPLPLPTALYVVGQVTAALDYAHRRKNKRGEPMRIIHRDVSPHNVLISREGQVKLADFGLARATISAHKTHAGIIRGKFAYMARRSITASTSLPQGRPCTRPSRASAPTRPSTSPNSSINWNSRSRRRQVMALKFHQK
jgi:serine/threonine protein kinase